MIDPDCHYGDHLWMGEGACVRCGKQLRCSCGRFVREDDLDRHIEKVCPVTKNLPPDDGVYGDWRDDPGNYGE